MKIASKEIFCLLLSAEVVEASFEIAYMIAQAKKPHNIGDKTMHDKSSQSGTGSG